MEFLLPLVAVGGLTYLESQNRQEQQHSQKKENGEEEEGFQVWMASTSKQQTATSIPSKIGRAHV